MRIYYDRKVVVRIEFMLLYDYDAIFITTLPSILPVIISLQSNVFTPLEALPRFLKTNEAFLVDEVTHT
jgi:hypothetical protein